MNLKFSNFCNCSRFPILLQENSVTCIPSQNSDNADTDDVNSSKNELSTSNFANDYTNDSLSSADYFSFIDRSSLSNRPASTPDILKKRKYDFPSFKEPDSENSTSSATNLLPIEVDRTGGFGLLIPNVHTRSLYQGRQLSTCVVAHVTQVTG